MQSLFTAESIPLFQPQQNAAHTAMRAQFLLEDRKNIDLTRKQQIEHITNDNSLTVKQKIKNTTSITAKFSQDLKVWKRHQLNVSGCCNRCSLKTPETISHLFLHCPYSDPPIQDLIQNNNHQKPKAKLYLASYVARS
jgi:hypothetical protein